MDQRTFIDRLSSALKNLPLDDEAFRAFHAAYALNCTRSHLGECISGMGAPDSVLSALQLALRHQERPEDIPENLRAASESVPTEEFREALIAALPRVNTAVLGLAASKVTGKANSVQEEEALQTLLRESFWYYVLDSETADAVF